MKRLEDISIATVLLLVTSLLIAGFLVLFSYYGYLATAETNSNMAPEILTRARAFI